MLTPNAAAAQLMSTCALDSPERRGEIGCSIIESKPLPEGLMAPVFWHIDRFDSLDAARAAGKHGVRRWWHVVADHHANGRRDRTQARRVQVVPAFLTLCGTKMI